MNIRKLRNKLGAVLCSAMMFGGSNISNHTAMAQVLDLGGDYGKICKYKYCNNGFYEVKTKDLEKWRAKFKECALKCGQGGEHEVFDIDGSKLSGYLYSIDDGQVAHAKIDIFLVDDNRFAVVARTTSCRLEIAYFPFSYFVFLVEKCTNTTVEEFDTFSKMSARQDRVAPVFVALFVYNFGLLDSWVDDIGRILDSLSFNLRDEDNCKYVLGRCVEKFNNRCKPMPQQPEAHKDGLPNKKEQNVPITITKQQNNSGLNEGQNVPEEQDVLIHEIPEQQNGSGLNSSNANTMYSEAQLKGSGLSENDIEELVKEGALKTLKKGGKTFYIVGGVTVGGLFLGTGIFALTKFLGKERRRDEFKANTKAVNSSKMNVTMNRSKTQLNSKGLPLNNAKISSKRSIGGNRKGHFGKLRNSKSLGKRSVRSHK